MRLSTACFARALQKCTSRIRMHVLLTCQEVMPISKLATSYLYANARQEALNQAT